MAPNSYVLRNWVATGLCDLCADRLGVEPVLASPFECDRFPSDAGREYRNLWLRFSGQNGRELPSDFPRLLYALNYLRLRTFAQELPNGGNQMMLLAGRRDLVHHLCRTVRRIAPRGSSRRRAARRLIDRIRPSHRQAGAMLEEVRPRAVVVGSPGVQYLDQLIMIEAHRRGIPVHCVVNSWDNMTSRGPMLHRPDSLMVWNRHMRERAIALHQYPADRIHVVGSLQFSHYVHPVGGEELAQLYRRIDLAPGAPFVLYLTGAQTPVYEAEDVRALLAALEPTCLGELPVVVRVHPQVTADTFDAIRHPRLRVDRPPRFAAQGSAGDVFDRSEMRVMAALLASATLVVSSCGTTALLEAAVFDRPMIQLRWMDSIAHARPDEVALVRNYQRYEHIRPFDATGCRVFSDLPSDLPAGLTRLTAEAADFRRRRARAVEELATLPLGHAPNRVTERLGALLGLPSGSEHP